MQISATVRVEETEHVGRDVYRFHIQIVKEDNGVIEQYVLPILGTSDIVAQLEALRIATLKAAPE